MSEKLFHVGIKALIKNSEGKFLLLKVNPDELKGAENKDYWDIPGGRIQIGHSADETLRREVEEETGITTITATKFFTAVVSNIEIPISETEKVGLVLMVYEVDVDDSSKITLSKEHINFEWVDSKTAAERLSHKYPTAFTDKLLNATI